MTQNDSGDSKTPSAKRIRDSKTAGNRLSIVAPSPSRQSNDDEKRPRSLDRESIRVDSNSPDPNSRHLWRALSPRTHRKRPEFLISVGFHTGLLILLSLLMIRGNLIPSIVSFESELLPKFEGDDGIDIGSMGTRGAVDTANDIQPTFDLAELIDPDPRLTDPMASQSRSNKNSARDSDRGSGGSGTTGTNIGETGAGSTPTSFFGTRAYGESFVYVVDWSGSMVTSDANQGTNAILHKGKHSELTRYQATQHELMRSIDLLTEDQSFFVYMFSGSSTPMMNIEPEHADLIPATLENKNRFRSWLKTTKPIFEGTDPRESLRQAFKMEADAIFLLSDGKFIGTADKPVENLIPMILEGNQNGAPIHTVGMDIQLSGKQLRKISKVTQGEFKSIVLFDCLENALDWRPNACVASLKKLANISPRRDPFFTNHIADYSKTYRQWCNMYVIPLLQHHLPEVRAEAENFLHNITSNQYRGQITSVSKATSIKDLEICVDEWNMAWNRIDRLASKYTIRFSFNDLTPLEFSDAVAWSLMQAPVKIRFESFREFVFASDSPKTIRNRIKILKALVAKFDSTSMELNPQFPDHEAGILWISALVGKPNKVEDWRYRRKIATEQLIPLLQNGTPIHSHIANRALHNLTFHLFTNVIDRVKPNTIDQDLKSIAEQWKTVWENADQSAIANIELSRSDLSKLETAEFRNRLFVALGTLKGNHSFESLKSICRSNNLDIDQQLLLCRALVDFQFQYGPDSNSHETLRILFDRLAPNVRAHKFAAKNFTSAHKWKTKFDRLTITRQTAARKLFAQLDDLMMGTKRYEKTRTKLLNDYPETRHAIAIQNGLDINSLPEYENL